MPNRLSLLEAKTVFFAFSLFLLPSPAFAGFQWVAPSEATPAPNLQPWPSVTPVVPAPQTATSGPEIISPVIISGGTPTTTVPTAGTSNINQPASIPSVGGAPTTSLVLAPGAMPASGVSTDVVHGFAKNVPLAVALRQILPVGYAFSVDPDVDMGILVSFQGGKPWRDTLRDMLDPVGLAIHEQGQMVTVGHAGSMPVAAAPVPIPAPSTIVDRAPHMLEPPPEAVRSVVAMSSNQSPASMVSTWQAERGDSLRKTMETWCQRANVELNWKAEYDYPIEASFDFSGTFEDAVRSILTGFEDAHPEPIAELHANPNLGQRTLIVQVRGNSYSD